MEEIKFYLDESENSMEKAVEHTAVEFSKIRAGKAAPSMVEGVKVDYYGTQTLLNHLASITTSDAHTIVIKPFEKSVIPEIEKAIQNSGLGLNPQSEGETVRINVPALTEDRRMELVKQVKKEAENKNISAKPEDIIKDPYVLEFLNLKENTTYLEKELETELLNKLQQFLLEFGKGFSFVARQYRISTEDNHFYIDLVFYNYILKCFLLIDLKIGKLTHEDIGQMDFYVRYFEDKVKVNNYNILLNLTYICNVICEVYPHLHPQDGKFLGLTPQW